MCRTCNQTIATPRESFSAITTPMQRMSPRHKTTHTLHVPPESPRDTTMQMNQNEKDMDAKIEDEDEDDEDDDDENETILMMGE